MPSLMRGLLAVFSLWGLFYVYRTSFVVDGRRVFTLWDDGMISMQYARNLADGHGLVWIPGGERVQGFSNLGVTLVMVVVHLFPFAPERAAVVFQLLNLALLVLALILVKRVTELLFPGAPWVPLAATLASGLSAPLALWSLQGSDVAFVTVWLLGSALCFMRQNIRALALLMSVGPLLRLDVTIFCGVFLLASLLLPGRRVPRFLVGMGLVLAVCSAMMLWSNYYYGDPLPNTYYLKATGSPRFLVVDSGVEQLLSWLPRLVLPLGFVAFALGNTGVRVATSLFLAGLAYNIWIGGDWAFEFGSRFVAPALPLLLISTCGGVGLVLGRGARFWKALSSPAISLSVSTVVCFLVNPNASVADYFAPARSTMYREFNEWNYKLAVYLRENTISDTTVGVHWAGILPYFSRRPAIDVLGKSDLHIARMRVHNFIPAHSKWDWDYIVNGKKPDVLDGESRGLGVRPDFRELYYKVRKAGTIQFYLRKTAATKLSDPEVTLIDQMSENLIRRR